MCLTMKYIPSSRAIARALIRGGGVYSYICVKPN